MLSVDEVGRRVGGEDRPVSRTTLWRWIKEGVFPVPVRIGGGTVRWHESKV